MGIVHHLLRQGAIFAPPIDQNNDERARRCLDGLSQIRGGASRIRPIPRRAAVSHEFPHIRVSREQR